MRDRVLLIVVGLLSIVAIIFALITWHKQTQLQKAQDRNPFIESPKDQK